MADQQLAHDITIEAGKAAPPVAVAGGHFLLGIPLADWVAIFTLVYLFGSIGLLVPKYRYQFAQWRKARREKREQRE
jgi:hypothetical protein